MNFLAQPDDPFWFFPDEVIFRIAVSEPIEGIPNLCKSSQRINDLVCNNNFYWKHKYIYDFGEPWNKNIIAWKDAYETYKKLAICGKSGLGVTFVPTVLQDLNKIKFTACGQNHIMIIDINNNVWAFGDNNYGQLGLGDQQNRSVPTQLMRMVPRRQGYHEVKAKAIACGRQHTVLIDMQDNLWSFGYNLDGELGLGLTGGYKLIPTYIPNIKAKAVSCGDRHTVIIDINNNVLSSGASYALGDRLNKNVLTRLQNNIVAKSISCGGQHTMLIDMQDNVWSFGYNKYGQLGLDDVEDRSTPTKLKDIKAKFISCGHQNSMIIDMNDNILTCGNNRNGQLGLGSQDLQNPILTQISQEIKGKSISCGGYHSMIVDINDNIWVFGGNNFGQLGLGDNQDRNIPTQLQYQSQDIKALSVTCGFNNSVIILVL
jgi:alpha-tubulin suppressor-like RCC1 family protein